MRDDSGKVISSESGKDHFIPGGVGKSGNGSGPTGSRRDYGKSGASGASPSMDAGRFNPMNHPAADAKIYVDGV